MGPCLDSRALIRATRTSWFRLSSLVRSEAAFRRDLVRLALASVMEARRFATWVGREGIERWTKEGLTVGKAIRASWTAEACSVWDIICERCGRCVGKVEKGGEESRVVVCSGVRVSV